jgi:hypothetical protein
VLGYFLQKFNEFVLVHRLLMTVVLLNVASQHLLVLQLRLALGVHGIVERTHHLRQQVDGDGVFQVVVEGKSAEDLLGRQPLLLHFIIQIGSESSYI